MTKARIDRVFFDSANLVYRYSVRKNSTCSSTLVILEIIRVKKRKQGNADGGWHIANTTRSEINCFCGHWSAFNVSWKRQIIWVIDETYSNKMFFAQFISPRQQKIEEGWLTREKSGIKNFRHEYINRKSTTESQINRISVVLFPSQCQVRVQLVLIIQYE